MATERKTALITGGSSGIGAGIAQVLAEEGYDIAITYGGNADGAQVTKAAVEALGRRCAVIQADLSHRETPEAVVAAALEALGRLDVLVCNAGVTRHHSILTMTADEMDWLYGLDYRGYILAAGAAARHMVTAGIRGNIVFVTSSRGERAYPNDPIYGGLKAALKRSCESIAMDLSPHGIRVNCIAPGATQVREGERAQQWSAMLGPRIPLGRLGTPRECGHAVAYLVSDKAAYITGVTLRLDGGLILPGMPEGDYDNAARRGWGRPIVDERLMQAIQDRQNHPTEADHHE